MVFWTSLFWVCILVVGLLSDAQSECHEEESLLQIQPKDTLSQLELKAKKQLILAADNDGSDSVTEDPIFEEDAPKMGTADEDGGFEDWDPIFDADAAKMGTADEEGGFEDWEITGGEDPNPDPADDIDDDYAIPLGENFGVSLMECCSRRRSIACGHSLTRRRRCCEHRRRSRRRSFRRRESPICKWDLCTEPGSNRRRQCDP